jgi:hypothetical protein
MTVWSPTCTAKAVVCIPVRSLGEEQPCALVCSKNKRFSCISDKMANRPVVLKDELALRGLALHRLKHLVGAVSHHLDLVPLGRIGDRHPQHRLIPLQAIARHLQQVALTAHRTALTYYGRLLVAALGARGAPVGFSTQATRPRAMAALGLLRLLRGLRRCGMRRRLCLRIDFDRTTAADHLTSGWAVRW